MHTLKIIFYSIAKHTGLFHLARRRTKDQLRILCYHGFSFHDEHQFRPKLFMKPATFERRMAALARGRFPVLALEEAVSRLTRGTLPVDAVVVTVDDGWSGVAPFAAPVLRRYGFPWTLYLTTYYVDHRSQVINMALQYLLWKSDRTTADFSSLAEAFAKDTAVRLKAPDEDFIMRLIDHVEGLPDLAARRDRLHRIGRMLDVDVAGMERDGLFFLMTRQVIHGLAAGGVDIQLHTHRHRPGLTREVFHREIADNISAMKDFGVEARRHFCYPSGQYSAQHMDWLREWGIRSATTCEPGFNDRGTNPLALRRFLDGENISQIEFEAEIYGFAEILRKIKGLLRRPSAPPAPAPEPDSETA